MTDHVAGCRSPENHEGICRDGKSQPRIVLPEPDAKGRPVVRSYARSSSWGKPLEDLNALMGWKCRVTLLGCVVKPTLVDRARAVADKDFARDALQAIANEALELGGAHEQANRGTAVHGLTDIVDQGRWDELGALPESIRNDLIAYRNTMDEHEANPLAIETFTVQDDLRVAGTFDRLLELADQPCEICSSTVYIGDLKTSRTANYPHSWAVQLAVYANSLPYDIESRTRVSWPQVPCTHRAVLVHLPAHQAECTLYWINIQAGWDTALILVPAVKEWRANKNLLTKV
jgi:hypothetical protein